LKLDESLLIEGAGGFYFACCYRLRAQIPRRAASKIPALTELTFFFTS
jgi:hypothetical protein